MAYDGVRVVEGLDLEVQDREFMVFVGPSGCGKSTALRLIAGLERPTSGDIHIGARNVTQVEPKDRDVAMVFQSYALYPHMSVAENIAFGLKVRKMPADEIAARVKEAAELLGLQKYLDRTPRQLSGGQRQRVALGRALVRRPSVFLFDEPLSNLDAELRGVMRAEIAKLQRRLATTTVYVTHDQVEAMTMGDRIAVLAPLDRGKGRNLMQVGAPLALYDRPANVFVAKFLGAPRMNFFSAVSNGDRTLACAGLSLDIPTTYVGGSALAPGKSVLVGIRPEHCTLGAFDGRPGGFVVSGLVDILETLGHETIAYLSTPIGPIVAKLPAGATGLKVGENATLTLDDRRFHLFDPETEARLAERL